VELIYECNFNKRKAKNIIEVSRTILKQGLARTKEELMAYPGVGVKIAMIYMNVAEGTQEGIGVDTHVHRICNRLGWVKTEDPNNTEKQLQVAFRKKWWKDMNIALVGFGQLICNAKKPLCSQCPVSKECPSSSLKW
jgi:endonuclease III